MTDKEHHADFLAADEEHRWTKPLADLATVLREAAWKAKGAWVYRILPGGACVAMRVIDSGTHAFQKELRISRREPLRDREALKKWAHECQVFRKHLGCEIGWHTQKLAGRPTGEAFQPGDPTEWVTLEDLPGKPAPICTRCGRIAEPGSEKYKEILCNKCATELGTAEVRERAEQHTLPLT